MEAMLEAMMEVPTGALMEDIHRVLMAVYFKHAQIV